MKALADDTCPSAESFTVPRRYLTEREVERLIEAAKSNRHGHRDATMVLVAYRHGLRASEVCDLQWHQVELDQGRLHVRRAKNGTPSVHPLQGDEIRALRKLQRENPTRGAYVFISERGGPMSTLGFHHLIAKLGKAAKMPFAVHPHMLRHACGFKLANDGHDTRALQHYLGHRTSSTRCATPSFRRIALRTSGTDWWLGHVPIRSAPGKQLRLYRVDCSISYRLEFRDKPIVGLNRSLDRKRIRRRKANALQQSHPDIIHILCGLEVRRRVFVGIDVEDFSFA
jgi:Phage integrase family